MCYPTRLLPKQHFKRIEWNETLKNHFLIHSTDTKDIIDPITGKLKIDLVVKQTDHLKDYSNNLLGVFLVQDSYWWPSSDSLNKEYLRAIWNGEVVKEPVVPSDYFYNEKRGYFFLKISDCHDATVVFSDNMFTNPICKVLHTPTNANFWHFSLRWFFDGQDLENWTDGIKRRMKTSAKAFIVEKAFYDEPNFEELDKEFYSN